MQTVEKLSGLFKRIDDLRGHFSVSWLLLIKFQTLLRRLN